ncbi:MAG: O-antigen ligase family protein, partial [Bdellovibrionaceae bacterium]|nr:O-antigen ligase family protein [Pseudobdellovibrionaceae bacterium]
WTAATFIRKEEIVFKWNYVLWMHLTILGVTVLSYFYSNNPYGSFWGNYNIPTDSVLSFIIYFLYAFILTQVFTDPEKINQLTYTLVGSALGLSIYGIIQHFGYDPMDWWGYSQMHLNAYATIGQAVGFATIVGCLLPLTVILFFVQQKTLRSVVTGAVLFLMTLGLMYSGSRTPVLLALAAMTGLSIIYFFKSGDKKRVKKTVALFLVLGLSQIIYYSESNSALVQKMQSDSLAKGTVERMQVWISAIDIWKKYPVLGSGPETFALELKLVNTKDFNTNQNWGLYWHKAHNHIIHYLATVGTVGLLAHLVLAFWVLFQLLMILKQRNMKDADWFRFAYLIGYAFIFLANLTAFNFIFTQFLMMTFPIIDRLYVGHKMEWRMQCPPWLNAVNTILIFILVGSFGNELFKFWNADRHFTLSRRSLELNNDMKSALEQIDMAIAVKPNDCRFYLRKASLLNNVFKYQMNIKAEFNHAEALRMIDELTQTAIDCEPVSPETRLYRGKLFAELYDVRLEPTIDRAEKSFKDGAQYSPVNPTYPFQLGALYMRSGRIGDGLAEMYKAIDLKDDYMPAYAQLLDYYYQANNTAEVKRLVKEIAKTQLHSGEFLADLNNIVQIAHNHNDAESVQILAPVFQKFQQMFAPK